MPGALGLQRWFSPRYHLRYQFQAGYFMKLMPQWLFDVYALSLPRGHGFGEKPPIGAWHSGDERCCGVVTQDLNDGSFGLLVMRRRSDLVWSVILEENRLASQQEAIVRMEPLVVEGAPPAPIPTGTRVRPALYDLQGRAPSDAFRLLGDRAHQMAGWMLNQTYLALPSPDPNWAADCQTTNFHTRLWEAQLIASFREQGLLVTQPHYAPDFKIESRTGECAWVEAVTANPAVPYNHVNAPPVPPPEGREQLFAGPAALRFAKTIGNKLEHGYHALSHVVDSPFALAISDFHASGSMTWSREGLIGYLYGMGAEEVDLGGVRRAVPTEFKQLLGASGFPAGLFADAKHEELSAVIFSNACAISKFYRVGISAAKAPDGLRYTRFGQFFDRAPGALRGIPFCLDITSQEYRSLWPQRYEPWSAELEVFHNPFARHPLSFELVPEGQHWFMVEGEMMCSAYYETSILWSQTIIQADTSPPITLELLQSKISAGSGKSR